MCSPCARALLGLDNQWKYGFLTQDSFLCDLLVTLVIKQKAWIKRAENELLKKKKKHAMARNKKCKALSAV